MTCIFLDHSKNRCTGAHLYLKYLCSILYEYQKPKDLVIDGDNREGMKYGPCKGFARVQNPSLPPNGTVSSYAYNSCAVHPL